MCVDLQSAQFLVPFYLILYSSHFQAFQAQKLNSAIVL